MERKLGLAARAAIFGPALVICITCWVVFFAVPLTPWLGLGPALFVKILAVILSSQAFGWAAAVALHGSPRRAWRQFASSQA